MSDSSTDYTDTTFDDLLASISDLSLSSLEAHPVPTQPSPPSPPQTPSPKKTGFKSPPITPSVTSRTLTTPRLYRFQSPAKSGTTSEWSEASHFSQGVPDGRVASIRKPPKCPRKKNEAYAVFHGRIPGVYIEWFGSRGAEAQVKHTHGALFQGYHSLVAAQEAFEYANDRNWTGTRTSRPPSPTDERPVPAAMPTPTSQTAVHNPLQGKSNSNAWFIVYAGITPGIYESQLECALNTVGLRCASYDSTSSKAKADRRWNTKNQEMIVSLKNVCFKSRLGSGQS
ncbi:hypothetical protein C8J57DRAFT_1251787 [Mycena rebaudengoi]|nr:hypothetical protein C8J57DRAFT_1251787 [Mycena rebaudengoi]